MYLSLSARCRAGLVLLLCSAITINATGADAAPVDDMAPGFFSLDERALSMVVEHYWPRGSFEDRFRPINITLLSLRASWQFHSDLEINAGGGLLVARGEISEPDAPLPRDSDATGAFLGGGLRYYPLRLGAAAAFIEGSLSFTWTAGTQFPDGGTGTNGLVQWGAGIRYDLGPDWALEGGYRQAHISNGAGLVAHNPAWNGQGMFIGLRRRQAF